MDKYEVFANGHGEAGILNAHAAWETLDRWRRHGMIQGPSKARIYRRTNDGDPVRVSYEEVEFLAYLQAEEED